MSASLNNQAVILYARGDLEGAMALHKEVERLCRELGNAQDSQPRSRIRLGSCASHRDAAARLADEALELAIRCGCQLLVPQIQAIRDSIPPGAE